MFDLSEERYEYTAEKATLAGSFIGSILYGVVVTLFFQCMAALLKPSHRREEGIKWWLVFYTASMFTFVTVYTAMNLNTQSYSLIDSRRDQYRYSTPLKYRLFHCTTALGIIPNVMFNLNNWLADGLLIYRCHIIYSTNLWAIALPGLMYLASLGMSGIMLYFQSWGITEYTPVHPFLGTLYLSISVSLNVLLTLMIVIRLVLHGRNILAAPGSLARISGLQTASTMLIESCALFAVSSLVVIGGLVGGRTLLTGGGYVVDIFFPVLAETQVIAPLLIIQRVANRTALTSHTVTTRHASSFNVRSQGDGHLKNSVVGYGRNPGELEVVVDNDQFPSGR